ncbi:MAG: hypothetical protein FWE09_04405 [Treponema sp.]|nr:hypothetical protein [Treponema sp.]
MADTAAPNYLDILSHALLAKRIALEKVEVPKLKDELRLFQTSFSALYGIFLRKKLISEDPYKQESKITEIEVPETGPLNEARRREQISIRLAALDSQLDFLVNFYQFTVEYLNIGRIRKVAGLVSYIDWINLTPDSKFTNTKVVAEIAVNSKSGDSMTMSIIGEALTKLSKCTASILTILKGLTIYHKENYKLAVRGAIRDIPASEATLANVKKKVQEAAPGAPMYQDLLAEVINEDYSQSGQELKDAVAKSLKVSAETAKSAAPKVNYKGILLNGARAMGLSASVMVEIAGKITENEIVLASSKKSFMERLRKLFRTLLNYGPEPVVYELTFTDPIKGTKSTEILDFHQFCASLDKRIKALLGMGVSGAVIAKLRVMSEEQIFGYLSRVVKDMQGFYRTLVALDEYFKSSSGSARSRIKGIRPELASVKNCIVKVNQTMYDYSSAKEEAEQIRRLCAGVGEE